MPEVIAREQDEKAKKELGLRRVLPKKELFRCYHDLSGMEGFEAWIVCVEPCEYKSEMDGMEVNEVSTGLFSMDTQPCRAAKKAFPDDAKTRDWGIKKIFNFDVKVGKFYPPYLWKFAPAVITEEKYFKPNMEVDVLDPEQCFIRAVVDNIKGETVT